MTNKMKLARKMMTKKDWLKGVHPFESKIWEFRKEAKMERIKRREELQQLHSKRRRMAL